jgi:predicted alpha/beta hydrolase family esterase
MQIHEESAASLETPLADASVLVIPGWNGSGAGHWQTLWEQKYPGFRRVVQHNWTRPSREDWIARNDAHLGRAEVPAFLVAHTLGCLAVAHWAAAAGKKADHVEGAFLVAPPWLTETIRVRRSWPIFFARLCAVFRSLPFWW